MGNYFFRIGVSNMILSSVLMADSNIKLEYHYEG